jgi:hypothetical protein
MAPFNAREKIIFLIANNLCECIKIKKSIFLKMMIYFFLLTNLFSERERGNQHWLKKLWKNLAAVKIKSAATNST